MPIVATGVELVGEVVLAAAERGADVFMTKVRVSQDGSGEIHDHPW